MVDQMIHSQLGSLQSSAPTAPSWREEKKLEGLEEGKKDDELAPIYVEGRALHTEQPWGRRAWILLALGVLLVGLLLLLTQMPGGEAVSEMETAGPVVAPLQPEEPKKPSKREGQPEQKDLPTVGENASENSTDVKDASDGDVSSQSGLANYRASCPTLLKLNGACAYDLSQDDKSLLSQTLVRHACPDECAILDRYGKICGSLLKLDGGCEHDLSMEEKGLPQGIYVRLVCDQCVVSTTTAATAAMTVATTARAEPKQQVIVRPEPVPEALAATGTVKLRPSRWLAYLVSVSAVMAWAGLALHEYGWLQRLGL